MKILFISYYWPPSGRASLHWPLAILRNFLKINLNPIVLTVDEENFTEKDFSLLPLIPSDLKVFKSKANDPFTLYKIFTGKKKSEPLISSEVISQENKKFTHKISLWIRMNLFVPDARIGWYFSAVKKGIEIYKSEKFDAIVSIGPPHTTHLIGMKISKKTNVPFIPVLIDPWTDIVYYKNFKRNCFAVKIDNYFEKKVMLLAKHIVFVTKNTQNDFAKKYNFIKNKSSVFYWGYNEEDFKNIKLKEKSENEKIILHAGNIFDFQNPIALWKNIKHEIDEGNKIKLKFVGTVSPEIRESIKKFGISEITEYLGFLPYNNVLTEMQNADYLFVCASEPRHMPGKIFEYARTGNPIIAFNSLNDEVKEFLDLGNFGLQFSFNYDKLDIFEKIKNVKPNIEIAKNYSREIIATSFANLLKNLN